MDIEVLASGSGGNAYRIDDGHTPLLLECGLPFRALRERLRFRMTEIAGCLVSHSHADHSKAARDLTRAGVDCYMSHATADEIGAVGHRIHMIQPLQQVTVGAWTVLPFDAVHDVPCLGFLLASGAEKLLYLTDSAYCRYRFAGLTHLMIEVNFADDLLQANVANGEVDQALRNRIVRNHMNLERAKNLLRANDLSRVWEIYLIPPSQHHAPAAPHTREIQALTGKPTYIAGGEPV